MSASLQSGLLLVLVRHAKSSWKFPVADIERPLNKRGKRDAPYMAERFCNWLSDHQRCEGLRLLVSPARRAQDTAGCFAARLTHYDCERLTEPSIYACSVRNLLRQIRRQPDGVSTLVLFGHNPEFTMAVNELAGASLENLPTCGMAYLQPHAMSWAKLRPGRCDLLELDYPKLHDICGARER